MTDHYNLGNRFYERVAGPVGHLLLRLLRQRRRLEEAQRAKYDRVLDRARIGTNSEVLEIGCG